MQASALLASVSPFLKREVGPGVLHCLQVLHPSVICSSSRETRIQRFTSLCLREIARVGNDVLDNSRACVSRSL